MGTTALALVYGVRVSGLDRATREWLMDGATPTKRWRIQKSPGASALEFGAYQAHAISYVVAVTSSSGSPSETILSPCVDLACVDHELQKEMRAVHRAWVKLLTWAERVGGEVIASGIPAPRLMLLEVERG
jgi:hypothetical protein